MVTFLTGLGLCAGCAAIVAALVTTVGRSLLVWLVVKPIQWVLSKLYHAFFG
jgi:hypothetical protein